MVLPLRAPPPVLMAGFAIVVLVVWLLLSPMAILACAPATDRCWHSAAGLNASLQPL